MQDCQPTAAAPDDAPTSGSSAMEAQDSQGSEGTDSQDRAPVSFNQKLQEIENNHDDTLLYELNQIMEDLQEGLPAVPIPGPVQPQVLAEHPTSVSKKELKEKAPEEAKKPGPTPCRNKDVGQSQNASSTPSLRSLVAHEDLGNRMKQYGVIFH